MAALAAEVSISKWPTRRLSPLATVVCWGAHVTTRLNTSGMQPLNTSYASVPRSGAVASPQPSTGAVRAPHSRAPSQKRRMDFSVDRLGFVDHQQQGDA